MDALEIGEGGVFLMHAADTLDTATEYSFDGHGKIKYAVIGDAIATRYLLPLPRRAIGRGSTWRLCGGGALQPDARDSDVTTASDASMTPSTVSPHGVVLLPAQRAAAFVEPLAQGVAPAST